jgi:hypothetical protein
MKNNKSHFLKKLVVATSLVSVFIGNIAMADFATSVVVVPYYVDEDTDTEIADLRSNHYLRVNGYIMNQLAEKGLDVRNATAMEDDINDFNVSSGIARHYSQLSKIDLHQKYGVDYVFASTLILKTLTKKEDLADNDPIKKQRSDWCEVRVTGELYGTDDRAGSPITWRDTRKFSAHYDCSEVKRQAEAWVADEIGETIAIGLKRRMAHKQQNQRTQTPPPMAYNQVPPQNQYQQHAPAYRNAQVQLQGFTQNNIQFVFSKIINSLRGIQDSRLASSSMRADYPQANKMTFDLKIDANISIAAIANNINEAFKQINCHGGKTVLINGKGRLFKEQRFSYALSEISTISGFEFVGSTPNRIIYAYNPKTNRKRVLTGLDGCNR